ncbi:MAG: transcriptional regulator, partial [Eubacterium sp.]|nr:transcriptional regulator [Eubacterium sp.]
LQHFTDATSGNLGAQLVKLEEYGYINCKKEFINRKPQSTYQLTEKGLSEFKGYVALLEKVLKGIRE